MSVRMPKPLIAVCMTLPLFGLGTHGLAAPAKGHHPAHTAPASLLPATIALPGSIKKYSGTPIDVLTYHYDNFRTGWNQAETDLTPATVASRKFGLLKTLKVDGNVFAQPLLVTNVTVADGTTHDILIVATGHDTVYAYDAQSYAILWQVSLGTPQSSNDVGCGDVVPEYGITSTPVVIRSGAAATLYVVAATEATHLQFASQLHALNVATGADILPAVTIAPSATLSRSIRKINGTAQAWPSITAISMSASARIATIAAPASPAGCCATTPAWPCKRHFTRSKRPPTAIPSLPASG
jgi:hypothetical protein